MCRGLDLCSLPACTDSVDCWYGHHPCRGVDQLKWKTDLGWRLSTYGWSSRLCTETLAATSHMAGRFSFIGLVDQKSDELTIVGKVIPAKRWGVQINNVAESKEQGVWRGVAHTAETPLFFTSSERINRENGRYRLQLHIIVCISTTCRQTLSVMCLLNSIQAAKGPVFLLSSLYWGLSPIL